MAVAAFGGEYNYLPKPTVLVGDDVYIVPQVTNNAPVRGLLPTHFNALGWPCVATRYQCKHVMTDSCYQQRPRTRADEGIGPYRGLKTLF